MSKIADTNEKIKDSVVDGYKKIERASQTATRRWKRVLLRALARSATRQLRFFLQRKARPSKRLRRA